MNKPISEQYGHDVVIALCAGLYFSEGKFYPTKYVYFDDFGMLGGSIHMDEALALHLQKKAVNFLFSAGARRYPPEIFSPHQAHGQRPKKTMNSFLADINYGKYVRTVYQLHLSNTGQHQNGEFIEE